MTVPARFREHVAKRIKNLHDQYGLSVTEMCDVMNITRHTWDATINCRREVKAIELHRLARRFRCDISYFYPWVS